MIKEHRLRFDRGLYTFLDKKIESQSQGLLIGTYLKRLKIKLVEKNTIRLIFSIDSVIEIDKNFLPI